MAFKIDSFKYYIDGLTPKKAFAEACKKHGTTPSGCMTDYSSSYMSDDIRNVLKKRVNAGCEETKRLLGQYIDFL